MAFATGIPDLNELPREVEVSNPPPAVAKKRSNRKKTAGASSEVSSVTAQGTTTSKSRRPISRAKGVAVVTQDPLMASEVDVHGALVFDPGCIMDIAPPKKRAPRKKKGFLELLQGSDIQVLQTTCHHEGVPQHPSTSGICDTTGMVEDHPHPHPCILHGSVDPVATAFQNAAPTSQKATRKTSARKKKPSPVTLVDKTQCHVEGGPVTAINPACAVHTPILPEVYPECTTHSPDGSFETQGILNYGLPPLLSVLRDTPDALREEIADSLVRDGGEAVNEDVKEVVDPSNMSQDEVEDNHPQQMPKPLPRPKIKRDLKKKWGDSIKGAAKYNSL